MTAAEKSLTLTLGDFRERFAERLDNFRHHNFALAVLAHSLLKLIPTHKAFQIEIRHFARRLDADYSRDLTFQILEKMKSGFYDALTADQWDNLRQRISLVYEEFEGKLHPDLPNPEHIFVIHPRTRQTDINQDNSYGDAAAFCPELGLFAEFSDQQTELLTLELLNSLPPFRAASTTLVDSANQKHYGAVVCVPFNLDRIASLTNGNGDHDIQEIAQIYRRMLALADFCYKTLGAKIVGLGASTPAMTDYGQELNSYIPEMLTTTGHGMTVALMLKTMYMMAKERKILVEDAKVTLIGCGRVGTAFSTALLQIAVEDAEKADSKHNMPKSLILFDKNPLNSLRLATQLRETFQNWCPLIKVVITDVALSSKARKYLTKVRNDSQIEVVQTNSYHTGLVYACNEGSLLIGAATSSQQTELEEELTGAIQGKPIVDDSQPTFFDASARNIAFLSWVSAVISGQIYSRHGIQFENGKIKLKDGWDYGPQGLERDDQNNPSVWGCELEMLLQFLQMIMNPGDPNSDFARTRVKDAVLPEQVVFFLRLFEQFENENLVKLSAPQSFGRRIRLS